jgi:inosose dehydratase
MRLRLATGPVSWGVDFADDPHNPPWAEVLDGIAASGLRWTELGPVGYLPEQSERLLAELGARGLRVAGSFVFQPLHDPAQRASILDVARRTCALIAAAEGSHLVILDCPCEARAATAGREADAPRLDARGWEAFATTTLAVAQLARDEYGLRPVFHPHAGTYVEFADEIERLARELDAGLLGLCVDTGHCAYAGVDPAALIAEHGARVSYLHFKDVDGAVLADVRAQHLDFWTAIEREAFCPLGRGLVDFAAVRRQLDAIDFDGWATIEQDRRPGASSSPLADLRASIAFLAGAGLGEAGA